MRSAAESAGPAENGRPFPARPWKTGRPVSHSYRSRGGYSLKETQKGRLAYTRNTAEVAHFQIADWLTFRSSPTNGPRGCPGAPCPRLPRRALLATLERADAESLHVAGNAVRGVRFQVGHRDVRAFARQGERNGAADAVAAAGDDRRCTCYLHYLSSFEDVIASPDRSSASRRMRARRPRSQGRSDRASAA